VETLSVVFAGNTIDVMLTHDHDRQFISIYTSHSIAVAILTFHNCHRRDGVHARPQTKPELTDFGLLPNSRTVRVWVRFGLI